jgi:hypothetical protein
VRHDFHERCFGYVSRRQNEDTIATIVMVTIHPRDIGIRESLPHGAVQPVADREPVKIGTTSIPEPLDVNHHNGAVHGGWSVRHPVLLDHTDGLA